MCSSNEEVFAGMSNANCPGFLPAKKSAKLENKFVLAACYAFSIKSKISTCICLLKTNNHWACSLWGMFSRWVELSVSAQNAFALKYPVLRTAEWQHLSKVVYESDLKRTTLFVVLLICVKHSAFYHVIYHGMFYWTIRVFRASFQSLRFFSVCSCSHFFCSHFCFDQPCAVNMYIIISYVSSDLHHMFMVFLVFSAKMSLCLFHLYISFKKVLHNKEVK